MSYRVSTQVYNGPFDLLLQLVTRQKVDIGAISISEVAEQYLAEAERIEALDLDVASDFLLVAATLLDIKAASLVPQEAPRKTEDDDEDDEDLEELSALDGDALREVLIQRLIAYKQFKARRRWRAHAGREPHASARCGPDPEFLGLMPDYLAGITLRGLAVICADRTASARLPAGGRARGTASRAARPDGGLGRPLYHGAPNLHLPRAAGRRTTTEQLVVTFLAMLELAKRGSLTLSQDEIFGTIQINRVEGAEAYVPGEGPELTE
ncbi:MAG: segregation and condensation protein A [Collinsella sp.]